MATPCASGHSRASTRGACVPDYGALVGAGFAYGGRGPDQFDCYGLVMHLHAQRGQAIPDYRSPTDQGLIAGIFGSQLPLWRQVDRPREGVVALIRVGRLVSHCGYLINDTQMIHTWEKSGGVVIEDLAVWQHRIVGFYEFAGQERNA